MNDISYNNWQLLSDSTIEASVGNFIKIERQRQNKTQTEVAKAADMSRSTLSLLERGEKVHLSTLIRVLRVLGKLQVLSGFEIKESISPLALAKQAKASKQRIRKKGNNTEHEKTDW